MSLFYSDSFYIGEITSSAEVYHKEILKIIQFFLLSILNSDEFWPLLFNSILLQQRKIVLDK